MSCQKKEIKMPELPQKKVGIISCSGEELSEGTVSRLAALKVLEKLRPNDTVTICLPLFLAGGEGDRAFAKFYPTIAIDGCEKRCAYHGTEKYSNKPAGSIVVSELVAYQHLNKPEGKRKLNSAGMQLVDVVAEQVAENVDELLGKGWSRQKGAFTQTESNREPTNEVIATCSCGSGIPIQEIHINGKDMTIVALPLIFQNFHNAKKSPSEPVLAEMMEMVKIYNGIDPADESEIRDEINLQYLNFWHKQEASRE
jgi:uncharacterized metal-binding protein